MAATALSPPRKSIDIQTILEHVYLAEFDLLRGSRHEVSQQPWAQPAEREASTMYFKLKRSQEEIQRLNVEIRRLWSWMEDEEEALSSTIEELTVTNPPLATQLMKEHEYLLSLNQVHFDRFYQLQSLDGFTGSLTSGIHKGKVSMGKPKERVIDSCIASPPLDGDSGSDYEPLEEEYMALDLTLEALDVYE